MADMQQTNAEHIRVWLRENCPAIEKKVRFGVNFLKGQGKEYGIITIPSQLRTRENILGEEVPLDEQTQSFFFAAWLPYTQDISQHNANLAFFQTVIGWLWERNAAHDFPEWDGGRIKSIVPTLTADIARATASEAEYRIQIKVTYRRA